MRLSPEARAIGLPDLADPGQPTAAFMRAEVVIVLTINDVTDEAFLKAVRGRR